MIPTIILRSPSTALIKQTLLSSGPCTTQALHSLLHQSGSPLPNRPTSSSFLTGAARSPARSTRSATPTPEQPEGTWSKSYLKHRLLAPMEQRGELVKITRGRWEKAAGVSSPAPSAGATAGAQQKGQQRHEEEHVWVVGEEWQKVLETSKERRDAEKAARRVERDQGVGAELKRDWGVSM